MHRIDAPGATGGNLFTNGNPATATPATDVDDAWLNDVQEEVCNLITNAGIALVKGTQTQLRDAIKRMYGGFVTSCNFAGTPWALTLANAGLVLVDASGGNVVLNLPAAAVLPGARFTFVRTDTSGNSVTVNRAGADTFDSGQTSFALGSQGDTRDIKSDGVSVWRSGYIPAFPSNKAINSSGDIDQANEGALVTQVDTGVEATRKAYGPDKWFVRNATGVNATIQRVAAIASSPGVKYEIAVKSAGAGGATSPELYHILDEAESEELYNRAVSSGALVRAYGNVTQVGVQLVYKTTAARFDGTNTIGAEVLIPVSAGAYSFGAILAQALGTVITPGTGIYGVRFRITAVSAGAIADNGNGFGVTQFQLSLGIVVNGLWQRAGRFAEELVACKRAYEKTYSLGTAPAAADQKGQIQWDMPSAGVGDQTVKFSVEKRAIPTVTHYSGATGASGKIRDFTTAADLNVGAVSNTGTNGYVLAVAASPAAGDALGVHATWDARIM